MAERLQGRSSVQNVHSEAGYHMWEDLVPAGWMTGSDLGLVVLPGWIEELAALEDGLLGFELRSFSL